MAQTVVNLNRKLEDQGRQGLGDHVPGAPVAANSTQGTTGMAQPRVNPNCKLEDQGIEGLGSIHYNLLEPALIEAAMQAERVPRRMHSRVARTARTAIRRRMARADRRHPSSIASFSRSRRSPRSRSEIREGPAPAPR